MHQSPPPLPEQCHKKPTKRESLRPESWQHEVPQFTPYKIHNLNSPLTIKETEFLILKLPKIKSPGLDGFTGEFYQMFNEELTPILHKLFEKIEEEGMLPNSLAN